MLDPEIDLFPPSSPTISSISSSDFDTESTGSFFHDRSTSLGTLMGVDFPQISVRVSSRRENINSTTTNTTRNGGSTTNTNGGSGGGGGGGEKRNQKKKKVGWWKLCRNDETRPSSLADFLEVERRFGDEVIYGATAELEGMIDHHHHQQPTSNGNRNGRLLFADGRVLPPSEVVTAAAPPPIAETLCRFPILLSGICSGGGSASGGGV